MFDPTWIGSLTDLATFILVVSIWFHRAEPHLTTLSAAVVSLARQHLEVNDDSLQNELDVDDRQVDAVETTIVRKDGGRQGDD
jgi:hypothetical protein